MVKYTPVVVEDTQLAVSILKRAGEQAQIELDLEWCPTHLVSYQVSWEKEENVFEAYYIPVGHTIANGAKWDPTIKKVMYTKGPAPNQCCVEEVTLAFEKYIALNSGLSVMGHNLKSDLKTYYKTLKKVKGTGYNPVFKPLILDTLALCVLVGEKRNFRSLKYLVKKHCNYQMTMLTEVAPDVTRVDEVNVEDIRSYGVDDVVWCKMLSKQLLKRTNKLLLDYWHTIESGIVKYCATMEHWGFPLDTDMIRSIDKEYEDEIEEMYAEIHARIDLPEDLSLTSNSQKAKYFFDTTKMWDAALINKGREDTYRSEKNNISRGKNGLWSVARDVLEDIPVYEAGTPDGVWIAQKLVDIGKLEKIRSMFSKQLPELVDENSRIHCQFKQYGTDTGRFACAGPNLQQISSRFPKGLRLREAFVPREGWLMLGADFSQMELRVLAHIAKMVSGDETLLNVFKNGEDAHQTTADLINGSRGQGKTVNFASVFGIGPAKLAKQLGVTVKESRKFLKLYWQGYPGITKYAEVFRAETKRTGFVPTLFGRRRDVRDMIDFTQPIKARRREIRYTGNIAINTPIQGSSADIVKKAMVVIYEWLDTTGLLNTKVVPLAQVHDELLFEVHPSVADMVKEKVFHIMETCVKLDVALEVDGSIGSSWKEVH